MALMFIGAASIETKFQSKTANNQTNSPEASTTTPKDQAAGHTSAPAPKTTAPAACRPPSSTAYSTSPEKAGPRRHLQRRPGGAQRRSCPRQTLLLLLRRICIDSSRHSRTRRSDSETKRNKETKRSNRLPFNIFCAIAGCAS